MFFLLVCAMAIFGYVWAGWNLMDAVYMVIITIFGVGYGEMKPIESPALRALTIATIVAGYAAVIYTVGGFVQMLIDGNSPLVGRTIGDIEIRGNLGFLIVAIRRTGGGIEMNPSSDAALAGGDTVVVLGHEEDLPQLAARYAMKQQQVTYRGATIGQIGGSGEGFL